MRIGFMGIAPGCGVSAMAAAFAQYLATERKWKATLCEPFKTSLFDGLGMEKRFAARGYTGLMKEDGSLAGRAVRNIDKNVNWILRSTVDKKFNIDWRQMIRLIYSLEGEPLLMDFSGAWEAGNGVELSSQDHWELLGEMDKVVVFVDPLPSKMLAGHELMMKLRLSQRQLCWIVNKHNPGVSTKQVNSYLKMKNYILIPHLNPDKTYGAEYACQSLYETTETKGILKPSFEKLEEALW